jgi:tetratricopeptide (TPR) repeat protein
MNHSSSSRMGSMLVRSLALTAVLALGMTSCGDDDGKKGGETSSVAPDADKAAAALDEGLQAHAAGDLTTAAEKYQETLIYDATNKFAFYNLALIDEASGNYGLAEEKYRAALKADPAYEPALFNLAILRTSSDPKEAIGLYRAAVAANKKDAAAWLNLGLLLRAAGDKDEGDEAVAKAIELNPKLKDPAATAE